MSITSTQYTDSKKNQLLTYWKVGVYSKLFKTLQYMSFYLFTNTPNTHTFPVKPLFTCKDDRKKKVNAFRWGINH